jgi:hypothetical protein
LQYILFPRIPSLSCFAIYIIFPTFLGATFEQLFYYHLLPFLLSFTIILLSFFPKKMPSNFLKIPIFLFFPFSAIFHVSELCSQLFSHLKYFVTIYAIRKCEQKSAIICPQFFSIFYCKFFSKSKKGNRFWTFLKMSNFQNLKYFWKNSSRKNNFEHIALIFIFLQKKVLR